ncbi:MAG: dethiobiotin synthase [Pirellulales bacterium]
MSRGLFITGTGTGVGKTYVAALIAKSLVAAGKKVGVYKPVASGCELRDGKLVSADAVALWDAAGRPGTIEQVCPQLFAAPLAPHLAARAEGKRVDAALLRSGLDFWRQNCDIVLVEGAGGLMSPLSDDDYNADLAEEFGLPLVVVAANVLGTINATLQTLIVADTFRDGLNVAGIILNSPQPPSDDPSTDSNADELAGRCVAPLLARVAYDADLGPAVDWWKLAAKV